MRIEDFLGDPGSATAILKKVPSQYHLEVLYQGFYYDNYYRVVSISLDAQLILIGVSCANNSSPGFIDILEKSQTQPIGVRLFDGARPIRRLNMQVSKLVYDQINEPLINTYLKNFRYKDEVYVRQSLFVCGDEEMRLTEYIIPHLAGFLSRLDVEDLKENEGK